MSRFGSCLDDGKSRGEGGVENDFWVSAFGDSGCVGTIGAGVGRE